MSDSIFKFGFGDADGSASMASLLGGKGANLAEMSKMGLQVPPGVTIPTTTLMSADSIPHLIDEVVMPELYRIEKQLGYAPLWSVRSGAAVSMPGMMDTLLNVGLTKETFAAHAARMGEHAAYDCWTRLIDMVVDMQALPYMTKRRDSNKGWIATCKYGSKHAPGSWEHAKRSTKHLSKHVEHMLNVVQLHPAKLTLETATVQDQLIWAVQMVRKSWMSQRAIAYRKAHGIPETMGTACTIQMMVFGNLNEKSCSGVMFSRNPATGDNAPMGEFLVNAQGEEVVAGTATPDPISKMFDWNPEAYGTLMHAAAVLESHYGDMQDIEFTVEDGRLWLLQCRSGKRTPKAAFKIAYDLVQEGALEPEDALKLVTADQYYALDKPSVDPSYTEEPDLTGIIGSTGVASGVAVFSKEDAINCTEPCVLIRHETTPDDFAGMDKAVAIVTATGGQTSHAAVVARQMDKPCVVGVTELLICDGYAKWHGGTIADGTRVSVDGSSGRVWVGKEVPMLKTSLSDEANAVFGWGRKKLEATGARLRMTLCEWLLSPASRCWIDLGNEDLSRVKDLLSRIRTMEDVSVVLDVSTKLDLRAHADSELLNVFSDLTASEGQRDKVLSERLELLAMLPTADQFQSKVVVMAPTRGDQKAMKLVRQRWAVVAPVSTLDELLSADGAVSVDASLAQTLGQALPKVMTLMKEAGRAVYSVEDAKHLTRLVFEVFGT